VVAVGALGDVSGQPDVSQDSVDHRRLVNQRHAAQPPTPARTGQDGPPNARRINSARWYALLD
jgi:hypothetical protein